MKILIISFIIIYAISGCAKEEPKLPEGKTLSAESGKTNNYVIDSNYSFYTSEQPETVSPKLLNSYTTKILTSDGNRYNNIAIVAERLHGYVLPAGASFSFNEICGPYGQSDGFLEATILLSDGTESKGFGGGVCQLSSTLYNTVKDLDVTITEHHHHSTPVAYVPINQDATVSLQSDLDFKFRNDYSGDLLFETSHDPDNLSVSVYLKSKNTEI